MCWKTSQWLIVALWLVACPVQAEDMPVPPSLPTFLPVLPAPPAASAPAMSPQPAVAAPAAPSGPTLPGGPPAAIPEPGIGLAAPTDLALLAALQPALALTDELGRALVRLDEETISTAERSRLSALRCRLLTPGALSLSYGQMQARQQQAAVAVTVQLVCPLRQAFRIQPRQGGVAVGFLRATIENNGQAHAVRISLLNGDGSPLTDHVYTGTGSAQTVSLIAVLQPDEGAQRLKPGQVELENDAALLFLFE